MRLIILDGPSHHGNTTTIQMVYNDLVKSGASVVQPYHNLPDAKNDFEAVLYTGKQVAFYSRGDIKRDCIDAIIRFSYVDVLVMAYNTNSLPLFDTSNPAYGHHNVLHKTLAGPARLREG